jgi:4-hydroxy-3-methylbut-2-en-1-yl diphosphate reductase
MTATFPMTSTMNRHVVLAFTPNNQLAVRRLGSKSGLAFVGDSLALAVARLHEAFPTAAAPKPLTSLKSSGGKLSISATQVPPETLDREIRFESLADLESQPQSLSPTLTSALEALEPHLVRIPYLHLGENDFIYKFRPEKERNPAIYAHDKVSSGLYQSKLCAAIKALARQHERRATAPVSLNFGAIEYIIPSHFGFCLGVKNAIERAYETLAANPGRRVFMLSELIHNPFVNEDLWRRGLRYLQTDKGTPFTTTGSPLEAGSTDELIWDTLTPEDIVIIPAFGATNEDKARLVRKGLEVYAHDATCMLVEKVWKAARSYGRDGYTVIIHGKAEHEETKATYSNTQRYAPAVIVRNLAEGQKLAAIIKSSDQAERQRFYTDFAGKFTDGFDIDRDLQRVAVVNQTTLLMNETLAITENLREAFRAQYGSEGAERVGGGGRRDTLCYATQVNQDALGRALSEDLDNAFVIGGKNSSNTYQLYRLCAEKMGDKAFFVQSEQNILNRELSQHFVFPAQGPASSGKLVERPLWTDRNTPKRILLTGGASCPDGLIQALITRLNSFLPSDELRGIDEVLADLEELDA